jgi:fibro-slime domain-containing protein
MRKHFDAWLLFCLACSSDPSPRSAGPSGGAGGNPVIGGSAGAGGSVVAGGSAAAGSPGSTIVGAPGTKEAGTGPVIITSLPPGFTKTETGGYLLGAALGNGADAGRVSNGSENCANILIGVIRDFKGRNEPGGHPDFEGPFGGNDVTPNLVATMVGVDQKPIYASRCEEGHPSPAPTCPFGPETSTLANFDQWYRYTPNVNLPYLINMYFAPQANGLFTFQSVFFFPVDGAGWGNNGTGDDGKSHNFGFTTELHTRFVYNGGETFQFDGDDDVWVFVNDTLAVDIGGLHQKKSRLVVLDTSAQLLGIQKGGTYNLDLFHAERHTTASTFRIDTNLAFVNCGILPPDVR